MRRVPHSYLWLLEPTKYADESMTKSVQHAKSNLLTMAAANGVAAERVLFAQRVGKVEHILRHSRASLFLDTVIYGAHSTATDALRGVWYYGVMSRSLVATLPLSIHNEHRLFKLSMRCCGS